MRPKCSAYLSIYNDWDHLSGALKSIAPYIDELVVVDGAYKWMADFLLATGRDPLRSDQLLYDELAKLDVPVRVVSQLWENEIEKRLAGYRACDNRYIFRVDADEISFFDETELDAFFALDGAVGEMSIPLYHSPGFVIDRSDWQSRQAFLFDRAKIEPDIHLNYLWLVLNADQLPRLGEKPFRVHSKPLAFNAHLSNWRTPTTSINRSAFYTLNYFRAYGVPWLKDLAGQQLANFTAFFEHVSPQQYLEILRNSPITVGDIRVKDGVSIFPTPLSNTQEATFAENYNVFIQSLAELNQQLTNTERHCIQGSTVPLDLSSKQARNAIVRDNTITFVTSAPILNFRSRLVSGLEVAPWYRIDELARTIDGNKAVVTLPNTDNDNLELRQILEFEAWVKDEGSPLFRFKIVT